MNDLTTTAIESEFHNNLINQFFQTKSYFFHRAKRYLDNPLRLTNTPHVTVIPILARFIDYLTTVKMPLHALQEVASIKGFEKLLDDLKQILSQYDFKTISPSQVRATIDKIAFDFLKGLHQSLVENEKGRSTLIAYLEIKSKLAELIKNSNGGNKSAASSNALQSSDIVLQANGDVHPIIAKWDHKSSPTKASTSINSENSGFQQQLGRLLQLIAELRMNITFDADFMLMRSIEARFAQLQQLAENYGDEQIGAIAARLVQLLHTALEKLKPADQCMVDIIDTAMGLIGRQTDPIDESKERERFFSRCDQFLMELENSETTSLALDEQVEAPSNRFQDIRERFEINTSLSQTGNGSKRSTPSNSSNSVFSSLHFNSSTSLRPAAQPELDDDEVILKLSYNIELDPIGSSAQEHIGFENSLKFRGTRSNQVVCEKSEAVLRDYHDADVSANAKLSSRNDVEQSPFVVGSNSQRDKALDHSRDDALIPLFQQEADWYFKVLFAALKQLKSQEKIQAALEDIELASSSLKRLARKFGIDKADRLPELIETISIFANQHIIKLPSSIIQAIEDGVTLLKQCDGRDEGQLHSLDKIVATLDDFSNLTMKRLPKN